MGRKQTTTHIRCRRCGKHSYHKNRAVCSSCGFGKSTRTKKFAWQNKPVHGNRLK